MDARADALQAVQYPALVLALTADAGMGTEALTALAMPVLVSVVHGPFSV